jgi:hypothetical protein
VYIEWIHFTSEGLISERRVLFKMVLCVCSVHLVFLTHSCRPTMGVKCLTVGARRSHQASANPTHPTLSFPLPLISHSPKHNSKWHSNNRDSHLLGKWIWSQLYVTECKLSLVSESEVSFMLRNVSSAYLLFLHSWLDLCFRLCRHCLVCS